MLASVRSVHAAVGTKVQMWRLNTEAEEAHGAHYIVSAACTAIVTTAGSNLKSRGIARYHKIIKSGEF